MAIVNGGSSSCAVVHAAERTFGHGRSRTNVRERSFGVKGAERANGCLSDRTVFDFRAERVYDATMTEPKAAPPTSRPPSNPRTSFGPAGTKITNRQRQVLDFI